MNLSAPQLLILSLLDERDMDLSELHETLQATGHVADNSLQSQYAADTLLRGMQRARLLREYERSAVADGRAHGRRMYRIKSSGAKQLDQLRRAG